ncbi:MAG: long-chain fatty acid--CoA ligase [Syntrophomonadaceae bacterium]|nr:long-chain fatty acid--CoA ligase [Syntrophomonadaceae bacterium]
MSDKPWLEEFEKEVARLRPLWKAAYDDKVEMFPKYTDKPPKWWFNKWAAEQPDKPYVMQGDTVLTYGMVNDISRRLGNALISLGVKKGDRVAIMSPNLPQYVIAIQALIKIGAIEVPSNPLYTIPELTLLFNDSGAETVIVASMFADKAIQIMKDPTTPVRQVIVFQLPGVPAQVEKGPNIYDFNEIIMAASNAEPEVEITMDDIVRLQYTGGTTGIPKGCMLTNNNVMTMAVRIDQWITNNGSWAKGSDTRALACIPINHVFGFMANVGFNFYSGGSLVTVPAPTPDTLMDAIEKHKPTSFPTVPALVITLLNHPRFKAAEVSFATGVFCGGSALPVEVFHAFEREANCRIVEGFGMSESCQQVTANPTRGKRKIGSVGVPYPDTDVLVVDAETGTKLMPPGQPGEVIWRGPQMMRGYWNNPEETANTIRDGWLYTGDIGYMDEDGFLFLVDRKKDMIICSGFNVYPREIDEVCYAMPEVLDACTIGVPHPKRGETPRVYIVLKEGAQLTAEEVIARCREKLAPYKVPTEVEFLQDLPRTLAGKADRKALREMAKQK